MGSHCCLTARVYYWRPQDGRTQSGCRLQSVNSRQRGRALLPFPAHPAQGIVPVDSVVNAMIHISASVLSLGRSLHLLV